MDRKSNGERWMEKGGWRDMNGENDGKREMDGDEEGWMEKN
ncbi:hypothetical protein A2U01_0055295 [Trifolium medium]|uniref:Uncharacterized protein n=1 Tax=Trifolium medium TaxID=97028 RepID=A0A392RD06_9FABA|nr:hypothetical protein [Trifolium medium]